MKKLKESIWFITVLGMVLSGMTFAFSNSLFGTEYVIEYFITIILVSTIPLWLIVYNILKRAGRACFENCIKKIFLLENNMQEKDFVHNKLVRILVNNLLIEGLISVVILLFYIYFGTNGILRFPLNFNRRFCAYALGVIPIFCGSYAGVIIVRSIYGAFQLLKMPINRACYGNYIFYLKKLKLFLDFNIVCGYFLCGLMYVAVLAAPLAFDDKFQPILFFLFLLVIWPLLLHVLCRLYLKLVREKILEAKFGSLPAAPIEHLELEVKRRKAILELASTSVDKYSNSSFVFSLLICISQIIVIFLS